MFTFVNARTAAAAPRSGLRLLPLRPRTAGRLDAVTDEVAATMAAGHGCKPSEAAEEGTAANGRGERGRWGSGRRPLRGDAAAGRGLLYRHVYKRLVVYQLRQFVFSVMQYRVQPLQLAVIFAAVFV